MPSAHFWNCTQKLTFDHKHRHMADTGIPKASDPKIWFTSMRSLAQVLSDENRALLALIRTAQPNSISELAGLTGRKQGNLSRTLKTMSRYGLVRMEKNERAMRPIAQAESYQIMA
jgi:predicted transcriptional regulator